eukprot:5871810-Pleurochrysis_carterae.AAC.1
MQCRPSPKAQAPNQYCKRDRRRFFPPLYLLCPSPTPNFPHVLPRTRLNQKRCPSDFPSVSALISSFSSLGSKSEHSSSRQSARTKMRSDVATISRQLDLTHASALGTTASKYFSIVDLSAEM